jgi:hypothetical protein
VKTIFFEKPFCTICYYDDRSLGVGVWEGFLSSEEYRTCFLQGLALIEQRKLKKYLLDNRKLKTIRLLDQAWTVAVAGPRLAMSSLEKVAIIVSEDIFNRMAMDKMFVEGAHFIQFDYAYFREEREAMQWLESGVPSDKKDHSAQ